MRALLVALILTSTALFVVGVAIERGRETDHDDEGAAAAAEHDEGAAAAAEHDEGAEAGADEPDSDAESRPLGIDVEATPLVALAVVGSLALAAAAWLKPRLAGLIAVAMLAFAALDVAEVFRQPDRDLAILAALIAALHLAAAAVASALPSRMARLR